ncbi:MAG: hypothetical protein AB8G96_06635 [Phycisphaerales bacterium]
MTPAARTLDLIIVAYRRWLSPHTPPCALRTHRGRCSCSAFGRRAVRRAGMRRGVVLIRRRTQACRGVALAGAAAGAAAGVTAGAAADSIHFATREDRGARKRQPRSSSDGCLQDLLAWMACSALFELFSCSS